MTAATAAAAAEYELLFGPSDGISAVNFGRHSDLLVVSSWDKGVRIHDAVENRMLQKYEHKGAVLDACFSFDDTRTFSGGQDGTLLMCDVATAATTTLGFHDKPIRCVVSSSNSPVVYTGGWDKQLSVWDYRVVQARVSTHEQAGKVYSLALADRSADATRQKLVVATSDRRVVIYDVRMMDRAEQLRESALQHQTRCVRCFPDGTGFALSSVEGRVAIEYFDPDPLVQQRKYAFKCHRATINGVQTLYPVNAIAFNPTYGTFATGGCDGLVNIWDGDQKKRICQYNAYPTSIAALDFNHSGTLLAVAASYTFEEGEKDHPPDVVFVRRVQDHEVRPKAKK